MFKISLTGRIKLRHFLKSKRCNCLHLSYSNDSLNIRYNLIKDLTVFDRSGSVVVYNDLHVIISIPRDLYGHFSNLSLQYCNELGLYLKKRNYKTIKNRSTLVNNEIFKISTND